MKYFTRSRLLAIVYYSLGYLVFLLVNPGDYIGAAMMLTFLVLANLCLDVIYEPKT